jgi:peptidoglycan lytic transglycosylase D
MQRVAFVLLVLLALLGPVARARAAPLGDDAAGRRAIRGAPVEGARESAELRALRELEDAAFPRDPDGAPGEPDATAPTAPAAPPPAWLANLKLPDLPVKLDPRVVRYLELYKSDPRARAIMADWLRKQGRWRALFEDALRRAHLPAALIYVAMIESGYDPHDRSGAGAVGLWQFMPENSRIYGLRVDFWIDERKNPERSTEAFTRYITDLKGRFGAWPLALAAFNAGYGALLRAMQKYNTNDYWELCRHEDGLPWDTVLYVPKAMATAIVGENRAAFGYDDLKPEPPYAYDVVNVPWSMSFAAMARAAGVTPAEIESLNPELRRKRTPPEPWDARVPRGAGERFAAERDHEREPLRPFVARFGERLDELAREFGATERELRRLNGIDDAGDVRAGVTLLVPDGRKPLAPPPSDVTIVAVPDKRAVVPGRKRVFYRALADDTIADVAAFFKVRVADLVKWNRLDPDARLAASMVLQLWLAPDADTSGAVLLDPALVRVVTTGSDEFFDLVEARRGRTRLTYTIKRGDDWKKVGKKFGLTVADLERINRVSSAHTKLVAGNKLTVYRAMTAAERARAAP